jgi:TraM recognition site of TraD and TraG
MFNSKYRFRDRPDSHTTRGSVEPTIQRYIEKLKPSFEVREIPYDIRNKHIYMIGKTRYGKSTLLYSIISQDIENGAGVCVLDPKPSGMEPNLVEQILRHIPPHRRQDVIYFSAAKPIPVDAMSWVSGQDGQEGNRQRLIGDIMLMFGAFMQQKETADSRWHNILRWAVTTLVTAKGCSFIDIYDFLADARDKQGAAKDILERVTDPRIKNFWNTFPRAYEARAETPILSRMSSFVLIEPVKTLLGEINPIFNIIKAINERKIILVDLTGAGDETASLLGILMVSRIQQAISSSEIKAPLHFFCDEFQNFQTSAFDKMLSEAGGLGLRLCLANQYLDQIESTKIRSSIEGNVSTFISFCIGLSDTGFFKAKMPYEGTNSSGKDIFTSPEVLANLPEYTALFSIARQEPIIKPIAYSGDVNGRFRRDENKV